MSWESPAADLLRSALADQASTARGCADDLDEAARLLEAHAQSVDSHLSKLAKLKQLLLGEDAA